MSRPDLYCSLMPDKQVRSHQSCTSLQEERPCPDDVTHRAMRPLGLTVAGCVGLGPQAFGPRRCPTCHGHGLVSKGFFAYPAGQSFSAADTAPDECRTCRGSGLVTVGADNIVRPVRVES
jgi:hypothetical protein